MKMLRSFWNYLETFVFASRIKRVVSSLALVVLAQLITTYITVSSLFDILSYAEDSRKSAEIVSKVHWNITVGITGFLIGAFLCLLIGAMIGYLAAKPLEQVNSIFKRLAKGHADWSEDIKDLPYPELRHFSSGYNTFMADIRNIIEDIRKSGIRIAVGSTKVYKAVDSAGRKTTEQKELSKQVSVSSADANNAIKEISENANYVSANTTRNLGNVRTSCEELETVAQKVDSINQTVASFRNTIEELNRNSTSIMEIVTVINDMSDQTNLLSLNATIEAARAGQHGKGFAVVAEEVRNLAKQIKPATEDISKKINNMLATVEKTKNESDTIIDANTEVNTIINETAVNFKSMIGDFEETNEQLLIIAAAIEELSLTNSEVNNKVEEINALSAEIFADMESSGQTVRGLNEITEKMQEMVSRYKTGQGALDEIIDAARRHRDHAQEKLMAIKKQGIDIFDTNYKPIPNTNPQKFTAAFTDPVAKSLQSNCDAILKEIPGCIYALPVDKNGYLPTHHSHVAKPMTGDYERDLLQSRDKRIYFSNQTEIRRSTNTAPMLLQTYMRDTGEVINDLSMPITVDGRHWGSFIMGLNPEIFTG
jgi:methyl-accepting chemotaxis protein